MEAGLKAGLGSDSQAICSLAGGVTVDSASLAAHSKDAAVYAGGASTGGIYPGTSVVLRGSTVTLDVTQGYDAVWAAQGGIVVEDSVVEIQGRKDANGGLPCTAMEILPFAARAPSSRRPAHMASAQGRI